MPNFRLALARHVTNSFYQLKCSKICLLHHLLYGVPWFIRVYDDAELADAQRPVARKGRIFQKNGPNKELHCWTKEPTAQF